MNQQRALHFRLWVAASWLPHCLPVIGERPQISTANSLVVPHASQFCGPVLRRLPPHSLRGDLAAPFVRPLPVLREPDDVALQPSTLVGHASFISEHFAIVPSAPPLACDGSSRLPLSVPDLPPNPRSPSLASLICFLLYPRGQGLKFSCRTLSTVPRS